jgi:hypothetical protein
VWSRLTSSPLHVRRLLRRVGLFVVVVVSGAVTGLYWRSAPANDVVMAGVSLRIEATVQPDASVQVTEEVTFDPARLGERPLIRRIPLSHGGAVVLLGVTDVDGGTLPAVARVEPGGDLAVRIGVRDQTGVVLRYELLRAVVLVDGRAVASMEWLGGSNQLAVDQLTASVLWPDAGGEPTLAQGLAGGRRLEPERSGPGVQFRAGAVPAHTTARAWVEIGAAALIAPAPRGDEKPGQAPAGSRSRGAWWNVAGVVAGLVVLAGWGSLHRRRGREYDVPGDLCETGPPSPHTPAEVGWLLRFGEVRHGDLTATLIDLASRGYVLPHRRDGRVVVGRGRPPSDLHPHEAVLLDWLFPGITRECDLDGRNADIRREPEAWAAMWERFVDDVRSVGRSGGLVEREAESASVLTLGFAGVVVVAAGVAGLAAGHPGWLACIVAGAAVLAWSSAFARRSPEGAILAARWEAFGRSLRGEASGAVDEPRDLGPQALAYAVALHERGAAAAVLDAHQNGPTAGRWPTQLIDREVAAHVNGWRESYLVATSIRGAPSERLRALLSLRLLRRRSPPWPPG